MSAALSVPRENAMGRPCYWTYPKDQSRPVSKQKEPESCSPLRNVLWLVQMQNHRPLEAFGRRTHLETRSPGDSGVRQRCGRQKVAEWMEDLGHGSEFARSCTTLRKKIETAVRFGGSVMTGSRCVLTVMYLDIILIQGFTKTGAGLPNAVLPSTTEGLLLDTFGVKWTLQEETPCSFTP
ncbi:uncharacterized protein LOC144297599 isoform X1 [Canis aureus]